MEKMERRLFDASREGNVEALKNLIREDPLLLERSSILGIYSETPLHIAAMLGHYDFAREILSRSPELASKLDSQNFTPLHAVSATMHVEMVRLLVSQKPETCRACDRHGRNPFHIAAIKGQTSSLNELLRAQPDAARMVVPDRGETILHLCVRYNQLEALKVLVGAIGDDGFINSKDHDGNTILHLAVLDKQIEVIQYLLNNTNIDVNAVNGNGLTALDILYAKSGDMIGQSLRNAGALSSSHVTLTAHRTIKRNPSSGKESASVVANFFGNRRDWLETKREAIMIAASLIAAAAFQAGVNPPGGVWQDTINKNGTANTDPHIAGYSVVAYLKPSLYRRFIIENTIGFVASILVFLLLLSDLAFKEGFFYGAFMVSIWVAVVGIAASYFSSLITIAPPAQYHKVLAISNAGLFISVALWTIIILWYLGIGPKVMEMVQKRRNKNGRSASALATNPSPPSV